jgi:GNAT superfamily N-acetyltransferase
VTASWRIEPLHKSHERSSFDCGNEALNRYLRELATQDAKRLFANCFVARSVESPVALGFYTLAAGELPMTGLPPELARKLPRYPSVPVVRIGRLAVDLRQRGKGWGAILIADAIERVLRAEIAAYALLVDAKDESAVTFYRHLGFLPTTEADKMLFLPLATMRRAGAP